MAKKTNIVCINHFRNQDPDVRKEEFNRKMAQLICRCEKLSFNDAEKRDPAVKTRPP